MTIQTAFWNAMYRRRPSWELGDADPKLLAVLDERNVPGRGRAIDLGCGTGDNAIALARRGFDVTAVDVAERALAEARRKADAAGVSVDFRLADLRRIDGGDGAFDLIVDRGLLMSLPGERARRAYAATVVRLASDAAHVYEFQWELPEPPPFPSRAWLVTRTRSVVLAPGELTRRLGTAFTVETVDRLIEPTDDPAIRRMGIPRVAKTSSWLTRRP